MARHRLTDAQEARIQAAIASDPDNPELTDLEIAGLKPFGDILPELAQAIRRGRGRPRADAPKQAVTLRLSGETIARYKAMGGDGWRARMSEILEKAAGR